ALKRTPLGPGAMAAARSLDVLLGAGAAGLRRALPAASVVGAHTLVVTAVSRREASGGGALLPAAALAGTVGVAALAPRARPAGRAPWRRAVAGGLLGVYLWPLA